MARVEFPLTPCLSFFLVSIPAAVPPHLILLTRRCGRWAAETPAWPAPRSWSPLSPGPAQPAPSTRRQWLAPSHWVSAWCPPPCCPQTRKQGSLSWLPSALRLKALGSCLWVSARSSCPDWQVDQGRHSCRKVLENSSPPTASSAGNPKRPPPPLPPHPPAGLLPDALGLLASLARAPGMPEWPWEEGHSDLAQGPQPHGPPLHPC